MEINRSDLSRVLKTSLTSVDNWVRNGCPHTKQGKSILFDLDAVQGWLSKRKGGTYELILLERLRYQKARARREELTVAELEKRLIDLDKLDKDLSFVFLHMKSALLLWEKRLPPLLEGKDQKVMYAIIHKETTEILRNFSRGTKALCAGKGRTEK